MKQITRKQHFVPRFYLQRFARDGKIQVLDVRAKRIGKPRPFASVCYDNFFYAAKTGVQDEVSQVLEDGFGKIENIIANALPRAIEHAAGQQLTNVDVDALANFMSLQWIRTPYFREQVEEIFGFGMEKIVKKLANLGLFRNESEQVEEYIRAGQYNIRTPDNTLSLLFVKEIPMLSKHFLAKKWRIFLSERPNHFITTDNPVAEWTPPRPGIFGASFMERVQLLALTPYILIATSHPDSNNLEQQPVERTSYHNATGKRVLMFNQVLATNAHQFVYAPRKEEFERLLKAM